MPKLMIFNREEEYIGDVKDVIQANQKLEINGEDSLTIETLDNRLEKGYRILYHDRDADKFYEYIIQEKEEYKDGKTIIIDIYADNSISELIGDYIEDRRSINEFASHAIERALEGTRWQMGRFYNGWRGTVTFYRTNARAAIAAIMDEWQLEMETEIEYNKESGVIKRTLHLVYERGQFRNNKLTYTRDIVDIKRKTLPRDIITALYGYGKGERTDSGSYTRRIDFSEINDGKAYVENNEAKELWGRVDNDGNKIHTFAKIEFESIEDKSLLLERTRSELGKLSKPAVSYEVSILDFFRLSKSKHKYIELGDTVRVIDRDFVPQISFSMRVVDIIRDLVNVENTRIILGETVKNIADRESEQDKIIEEINEEVSYDDWDDDWDDGGWETDPIYDNIEDLLEAYPALRVGVYSWIDMNKKDSYLLDGDGGVAQVNDAITGKLAYSQDILSKRPILKDMGGLKWLSFDPSPRVFSRYDPADGPPSETYPQDGHYLLNLKAGSGEEVLTYYVAYYDRTLDPIRYVKAPSISRTRYNNSIEDMYQVGYSSPLGYPFGTFSEFGDTGYGSPNRSYDRPLGLSPRYTNYDTWEHRPTNEPLIGKVTKSRNLSLSIGEILNLGMASVKDEPLYITGTGGVRAPSGERYKYAINTFYRGEVAEVIMYSRELDSREHEVIEDYLMSKYGSYRVIGG